jgi:hypothetical protein
MKKTVFAIFVFASIACSAQFAGTGYRISRDNAIGAHFAVFNNDPTGFAGLLMALPTVSTDSAYFILKAAKSTIRSTVPLDIQTPALTLNGSPFSGGSGLWTASAGKIYYNTNFVGIGTSTIPYPLSVQTNTNSDADVGVYFRNPAGTHTLSFFNDKFLLLQSAQPEFTMRATLSDTTVPRASVQFRDHLGVATGAIYNKATSLFIAPTTGKVVVASRLLEVQDGGFRVRDLAAGTNLISTDFFNKRTLVGPGVADGNSTFSVHPVAANKIGAFVNMDGASATGEVYGIYSKVDDDNPSQANIGIAIEVANGGASGEAIPIATVEPGLTAAWAGAAMTVNDVGPYGMKWKARPRPYAERSMTFNASGGWDQRTPVTIGVYFKGLDSLVSQGGQWAAASLVQQHMTSATDGSITYTGWTNAVRVKATAMLTVASNMGTGATSQFGCRWAVNDVGIAHTESRRYLPSTYGPQQLIVEGFLQMNTGDIASIQCVCGVTKALITYYSASVQIQSVE